MWEGGILEFRRSLIGARANKTLVPSNAITLPIYYVVIYSKTIFITIPSTLSCPTNTRDTHTHTHSCINSSRHFFSSLSFLRLTRNFILTCSSSNYNPKIFQFIHTRVFNRNLFPSRNVSTSRYLFINTPRQNLLENYIFCINVKPLCQTSIGERCHYEMAAFKAGEFVETTARPKAFRGIYIYIATIFTAIHVMISDVT